MRGWFVPLVLCRRGAVPVRALDALVQTRTAALLDELAAEAAVRRALADELSDLIHACVAAAAPDERSALLRLRRDVFNDRTPAPVGLAAARYCLAPAGFSRLMEWNRLLAAHDAKNAESRAAAEAELAAGRRALAAVAASEAVAEGVQLLSGAVLGRHAARYAEQVAEAGQVPRALRKTEETLVSLAYRSALKPSPYGSLTTVGLAAWQPRAADWPGPLRRRVRLDRAILEWMSATADWSRIRMANTTRITADAVEWYAGDQFRSRPLDDRIKALLSSGPEPAPDLISAGLIEIGPGLPDQEPDYAAAVAKALAGSPSARPFQTLAELELRCASAVPADRPAIRQAMADVVHSFADDHAVRPPSGVRAVVYEEARSDDGPRADDLRRLDAAAADLDLLSAVLPVFDDAAPARIGLYRWFTQWAPQTAVDVLDTFRAFTSLEPAARQAALAGAADPDAAALLRLRTWFGASIEEWITEADGPVRLDPQWLAEFGSVLAGHTPPWSAATWIFQSCDTVDGPGLVLNEVRSGHGMFLARYCEPGTPAADILRDAIARSAPRQTDLAAVLGHNYNLHPDLAPLEVEYPGARARRPDAPTLRDLVVEPDDRHRRLRLRSRIDGEPVDLRPLNGIHPLGAPPLYRFLMTFADTATYRGGMTDLYAAVRTDAERLAGFGIPRITLNRTVVQRRSWTHPISWAAQAFPAADGEYELLCSARRHRLARGLPERCFFRVVEPRDPAAERRARAYKPHYLDFASAFLLKALVRAIATAGPDAVLVFEECLPDSADYDDHARAAEEFAVEYQRELS